MTTFTKRQNWPIALGLALASWLMYTGCRRNNGTRVEPVATWENDSALEYDPAKNAATAEAVEDAGTLRERVARSEPGQSIRVRLLREGEQVDVQATLGQQPIEHEEPDEPARVEPPGPEEPGEAEALAKLGFQRLVALTPEIAREHDLDTSRGILVLGVRMRVRAPDGPARFVLLSLE